MRATLALNRLPTSGTDSCIASINGIPPKRIKCHYGRLIFQALSFYVSKILSISWAFKWKHLIFAIIFLHEIFSTDTSKPQNLTFLWRRVSLFRGLQFMLMLLCNCSCTCNFCRTFVIPLNAENVVPQENVTLMKSSAKILRELCNIFFIQLFVFRLCANLNWWDFF